MPSRMIHYAINSRLLSMGCFPVTDHNGFLLGGIAPDCCLGRRDLRNRAHFFIDRGEKEQYYDIPAFLEKYEQALSHSFIKGYYAHLLTDDLWSQQIYWPTRALFHDYTEFQKLYYSDFDVFNSLIKNIYGLTCGITLCGSIPVEEVDRRQIEEELLLFYNDFQTEPGELCLLTQNRVTDFIDQTVNHISQLEIMQK